MIDDTKNDALKSEGVNALSFRAAPVISPLMAPSPTPPPTAPRNHAWIPINIPDEGFPVRTEIPDFEEGIYVGDDVVVAEEDGRTGVYRISPDDEGFKTEFQRLEWDPIAFGPDRYGIADWSPTRVYNSGEIVYFRGEFYVWDHPSQTPGARPFRNSLFWGYLPARDFGGATPWANGLYPRQGALVSRSELGRTNIYRLSADGPYNSEDIDAEIRGGDWEFVSGSPVGPLFRAPIFSQFVQPVFNTGDVTTVTPRTGRGAIALVDGITSDTAFNRPPAQGSDERWQVLTDRAGGPEVPNWEAGYYFLDNALVSVPNANGAAIYRLGSAAPFVSTNFESELANGNWVLVSGDHDSAPINEYSIDVSYDVGEIVLFEGDAYQSLSPSNTSTPDTAGLWRDISVARNARVPLWAEGVFFEEGAVVARLEDGAYVMYRLNASVPYFSTNIGFEIDRNEWLPIGGGASSGVSIPRWSAGTYTEEGALVSVVTGRGVSMFRLTADVPFTSSNLLFEAFIRRQWERVAGTDSQSFVEEYNSNSTYLSGQIVSYSGRLYESRTSNNMGNVPTNTTHWSLSSLNTSNIIDVWKPGYYLDEGTVVRRFVGGEYRLYVLDEDGPVNSTNFDSELADGTWAPIGGGSGSDISSTDDLPEGSSNLYYTEARVSANASVSANTAKRTYPQVDETKLSTIEEGAEVNVQADWNESNSASDAFIRNKPTIPGAAPITSTEQWNGSQRTDQLENRTRRLQVTSGTTSIGYSVSTPFTSDETRLTLIIDNSANSSAISTTTWGDELDFGVIPLTGLAAGQVYKVVIENRSTARATVDWRIV